MIIVLFNHELVGLIIRFLGPLFRSLSLKKKKKKANSAQQTFLDIRDWILFLHLNHLRGYRSVQPSSNSPYNFNVSIKNSEVFLFFFFSSNTKTTIAAGVAKEKVTQSRTLFYRAAGQKNLTQYREKKSYISHLWSLL